MRARADHAAVVEHDDEVGVDHRREPVRDHEQGSILGDRVDRLAQQLFVDPVERRRRLVEQQDGRSREQRPRDREPLPLTSREHDALLADRGIQSCRVAVEHLAEVHGAQHLDALRVGRLGRAEREVVADAASQHRCVLLDVADAGAQLLARQGAHVHAVHAHDPGARVVEALDEREDRRLARPRRPDECDARAARHRERHAVQYFAIGRLERILAELRGDDLLALRRVRLLRVAEPHVVESDGVIRGEVGRRLEGGITLVFRRDAHDLLDAPERAERLTHRGDRAECLTERHDHEEEEQDECHEARDRDRPRGDAVATEPEHDQERHVHRDRGDRHDERRDLRDPDARAPRLPRGVFDGGRLALGRVRGAHGADGRDRTLHTRRDVADLLLLLAARPPDAPGEAADHGDREGDHEHGGTQQHGVDDRHADDRADEDHGPAERVDEPWVSTA
ncbi:hypothetical protein GCM10025869_06430 [Homoserinibacter gongjuensis]|uniref:Uncharacterized protein n=1 Tax=Homoserinibacter gongjuensis TaxID=1162968 RepID=A0ABQ6JS31_9MICO|nr:hypothetical protein GCM10025869_06430 [Homoserinibacter gongjuensis]